MNKYGCDLDKCRDTKEIPLELIGRSDNSLHISSNRTMTSEMSCHLKTDIHSVRVLWLFCVVLSLRLDQVLEE